MKWKLLVYLLPILIMSFFSQPEKVDNKSLVNINLEEAFEHRKSINIGDIATHYEYVQLETNNEFLAGSKLKVYLNDQYLITVDQNQILLFDRKSGKFIRKIGQKGDGPEQYSRTYAIMPYNDETKTVYAGRNKKRYEYSLDGKLKSVRDLPGLISDVGNIDENTIAAHLPNYQGDEKGKIIILNKEGSVIKTFPNYLSAPKTNGFFVWNPSACFYRLNKQLYFYELFNDTLFHVSTNSLTPRYVFKMGPYSPPYKMKTSPKFEVDKYFMIKSINEASKYLFCVFNFNKKTYTAIYFKDLRKTIVNDYNTESGNGFIYNINDFVPLELSGINEKGELICTMDAYRIKKWFEVNPEKIKQLPESIKILKNIEETDNPVIVIVRLKY